jgi:hypothetical protein
MKYILALALLLIPTSVFAQSDIAVYTLRLYNQGALMELYQYNIQMPEIICDQPDMATPTGIVVNPHWVIWDDPSIIGRTCRWTYTGAGSGPLFALPIGGPYDATLSKTTWSGEQSPESARSNPFVRAETLSAPSGVRLVK